MPPLIPLTFSCIYTCSLPSPADRSLASTVDFDHSAVSVVCSVGPERANLCSGERCLLTSSCWGGTFRCALISLSCCLLIMTCWVHIFPPEGWQRTWKEQRKKKRKPEQSRQKKKKSNLWKFHFRAQACGWICNCMRRRDVSLNMKLS